MRDAFFLIFMVFVFGLGFYRPYLATVAYLWIDLLQPGEQCYYLINTLPVSMISAVFAVAVYLLADKDKRIRFNFIQFLLALFVFWITITTINAELGDDAWFKWSSAWKVLGFGIFLPLVLRTRLQIETTLLVIVFTIAALMFSGAMKTLAGGGGYGNLSFLVDRNSGLFEASTLAAVAVGTIPLTLFLYRNSILFPRTRGSLLVTIGLVGSALLVVIGSEARTGLICIAAVALLEFRHVKRKFLTAFLTGVVLVAAVPFLPSSFTGRMGTIKTYDEDTSASTRVAMWNWTWIYVQTHPLGGGFEVWKRSQIVYEVKTRRNGRDGTEKVKDEARGFHSAFFEVLGEHGFPGIIIYLGIFLATLWQNMAVVRRYKKDPDNLWMADCARALTSFTVTYLIGGLFTGIAFQSTVYHIVGITMALSNMKAWQDEAARLTERARLPASGRQRFAV